jgi:VWFA-related protein
MRRSFGLILAALTLSTAAISQTPAPSDEPTAHIQANTQLVVVDVVVQDRDGHPVHGLKPENFHLTEGKTPQTIQHFEEHSANTPVQGPKLPEFPAGTFTDYTPVAADGTLNILLLDALNTPTKDQTYVRDQLQQYVKHAAPGTRIAIFGLANRLILLQGFTSDPQILKDAVDHKLIPRSSSLLDDPTGSGVGQTQASDLIETAGPVATPAEGALAQLAANLQEFEAQTAALETQLRVQFTLDAFNTLGHYLAAFPGRKNLIWFSASFPINILPDPTLQNSFATLNLNADEFRETTNLLSKAQVAVYPIDARGLIAPPMYNAASSTANRTYSRNPTAFSAANSKFNSNLATEHSTMDDLANDTGGKASYNTNGIAAAVAKAIDSGANYYTLSYSPTDHKQDGGYRTIHVDLTGSASNLQLAYRHGYYADDAAHRDTDSATATPSPTSPGAASAAYARAAMSRGAPAPQDILMKVRILPASTAIEHAAAPGNVLDKSVPTTGPFQRLAVDYVTLPSAFTLTPQPDGRRSGKIQFILYVFDTDGRLLNATGETVELNLPPNTYQRFIHSVIEHHLEISVPTRVETFLRVGIEDVPTNRFGVVEVPVSSISHLPPAVYASAPAPSKSAPTSPTPSTPPPAPPTPQE